MLRAERRLATASRGVRLLPLLASLISIVGGLHVATCVSAQPSPLLAQAVADSTAPRPAVTRPAAPATTPTTTPTTTSAPPTQRRPYTLHLHGGLFAPIDVNATSPTIGLRFGRLVLPHLQGGLLTGWTFRRKNLEEPVSTRPGLNPQRVLARVDASLVPAMAFLQVNLTERRFLVPYAGIAAGYEWLSVSAHDFRTNEQAQASYANFAWQGWGGFGVRLEQRLRADVELFYNGGKLERQVTDASGTWTEAVAMNGVGARVGLDILF